MKSLFVPKFIEVIKLTFIAISLPIINNLQHHRRSEQDFRIETDDYIAFKKINRQGNILYTQGIFFDDNGSSIIESGGLYGESSLVKVKYPSILPQKKINLSDKYFGEGIAKCGNYVYQLTWRERVVFKYTYPELEQAGSIPLPEEVQSGWGLSSTSDPDELIATDGSSYIYFLDCNNNLQVKRKIEVKSNGTPISRLNALSFSKNSIWSNVYYDNNILKINPNDGNVIKKYDMTKLVDYEKNSHPISEVLNGISYEKNKEIYLITGKKWSHYYEVKFN